MDKSFKKGEVVWAKVRGYSWWPGIVMKISLKISKAEIKKNLGASKEVRILVKFIGDNSHSVLPLDKIEKFEKKFAEFSKTKKKTLLNSIKLARKFINGEISLVELRRINSRECDSDQEAGKPRNSSENSEISQEEDLSKAENSENDESSEFVIEDEDEDSIKEKRKNLGSKTNLRKRGPSRSHRKLKKETSPIKKTLSKVNVSKKSKFNLLKNSSLLNENTNNNNPKTNININSSLHQRSMPNISLFSKGFPNAHYNIFNPNLPAFPLLNHSYSFDSFNNMSSDPTEENKKQNQNQQQQNKFFTIPDNNAKYIVNTNLNMQKILNYNINNINNINTDIVSGSKGYKKLLLEKRKMKMSQIESSSNFSSIEENSESNNNIDYYDKCEYNNSGMNFGSSRNNIKFRSDSCKKELVKQVIKNKKMKKEAKRNSIDYFKDRKSKNYFCVDLNFNNDSNCAASSNSRNFNSNTENNFTSDLSLEEDLNHQQAVTDKKLNGCFERQSILEELNDEEANNKVLMLRKACDGLLFYKINLSGASNAKNLLNNINQIHKVLDEIKNQNTFELVCDVLPILKILLNSKDVSVFLASTELCQKIKEKVLFELFECEAPKRNENNFNHNNIASAFPESLGAKAPQEFGEIKRLELINGIISEKLKELKKREEAIRLKELKKSKELARINQLRIKKSKAELTRNIKPITVSNNKEYLGIRKGSITLFDEKGNLGTRKNSESKFEQNDPLKNETTKFSTNSINIEEEKNSNLINNWDIQTNPKDKNKPISLFAEKKTSEELTRDTILTDRDDKNVEIDKKPKALNKGIFDNFSGINDSENSEYNKSQGSKCVRNETNNYLNNNNNTEIINQDKNKNLNLLKSTNDNIIYNVYGTSYDKENLNIKENCECKKNIYNINSNDNCLSYYNNPSVEIIKFLFEDFLDFKELINVLRSNSNTENSNKLFEENQENNTQITTNQSGKSINSYNNDKNKNNFCSNNNNYLINNSPNDNNSGNFFDDVYTKFNNLSKKLASKRKSVCIKLYNILKALLPEIDSMILKKTVIYFDYSLRLKDPELGNLYNDKIISLYGKIKEVITHSDKYKIKLMVK